MALVIFCVALVAAMRTRKSLRLGIASSTSVSVMPGLVPGIHVFARSPRPRRGWHRNSGLPELRQLTKCRKSGKSYCVTIFSAASDLRVEPSNMDIVGDIGQAQQSGDDAWSRLSLECVAQAATADPLGR